jgi:hypothetical protein
MICQTVQTNFHFEFLPMIPMRFYSSTSIDDVEKVMNEELNHIFQYCDANKLSVNINKTNFPRADGAKCRARVLIPPGYLHPGKQKH